jgi:serine phosphatase RsbU (regulator of sigma subunit)
VLADLNDDGTVEMVSCGHPSPLHLTDRQISEVGLPAGLPLGLGAAPDPARMRLAPGERLLLYTDGAIEARDRERRFIDLASVLRPALGLDPPALLEAVVSGVAPPAPPTPRGAQKARRGGG